MTTITKEQLISHARESVSYLEDLKGRASKEGDDCKVVLEMVELELELARIALASLEAKSRKLFTCSGCGAEGLDEPLESKCHCNEDGAHWVESVVYTAPIAQTSMPLTIHDEDFEKALSVLNDTLDDCGDSERGLLLALDKAGIEVRSDARRAAMLKCSEPVQEWIPCSERMPDKLIPVMVMYEDGEMWSAMWNGNLWDDGTEYPDPHSVTHWREMPAAPNQEVNRG